MLSWRTLTSVELHASGVRVGEASEASEALPCIAVHHCKPLAAIGHDDRIDVVDMETGEHALCTGFPHPSVFDYFSQRETRCLAKCACCAKCRNTKLIQILQ